MPSSDGGSKWTDRLVSVPLWYLLAGGSGALLVEKALGKLGDDEPVTVAQAAPVERDDSLRADVRAIAVQLDEVQAAQARMEGRLTSLERTAGELQQDVKTIKLAIR
jgi:hypothetical protein